VCSKGQCSSLCACGAAAVSALEPAEPSPRSTVTPEPQGRSAEPSDAPEQEGSLSPNTHPITAPVPLAIPTHVYQPTAAATLEPSPLPAAGIPATPSEAAPVATQSPQAPPSHPQKKTRRSRKVSPRKTPVMVALPSVAAAPHEAPAPYEQATPVPNLVTRPGLSTEYVAVGGEACASM
jgi:hypothetical protein